MWPLTHPSPGVDPSGMLRVGGDPVDRTALCIVCWQCGVISLDQNLPGDRHTVFWSSSLHQFQVNFVEELVAVQRPTESRYTLLKFQLAAYVSGYYRDA